MQHYLQNFAYNCIQIGSSSHMKIKILAWMNIFFLMACSFSQKVKDGEMAFERKQYSVAVAMLEKEFEEVKNEAGKARKAYLLGNAYGRLLEYQESKDWYSKSVKLNYGAEALTGYAKTCKSLEDYESAIEAYQKLGDITGRKQETDREVLLCRQAMAYKTKKPEYLLERIFENSTVSDYSPVLYDGQYLVFTSERKDATGKEVYKWTGERFCDIFIMLKNGSEVKKFDSGINTDQNDGAAWFSRDLNKLFFTRCYSEESGDDYCRIMYSDRINGLWSDPEPMPFLQSKINYGQATLIENDSILVFTADIEEPGGPLDLYYSELFTDGTWTSPEKLPSTINSQGNEKFPTGDGDTLYFSSDYWPGLGGYDIFKTYLKNDGTWSYPANMGYPINSGGDDFSFIIDYQAKPKMTVVQQGYFASSRSGSGKDDIFRFSRLAAEPVKTEDPDAKQEKELYLTVKTFTPLYRITDDPNSGQTGRQALGETLIKLADNVENSKISENYTDKNGFYYTKLMPDKAIKITGAKLGYLNASEFIDTKNVVYNENEKSKTINVELTLAKIYTDKEINLNNIYYDYDKWDIKNEAKPTLDQLVKIMNDNPQINIQMSSHTDCRGEESYNEVLSQRRAQSATDYLISKGISAARLIAKGYGESQLVDSCSCEQCTEDQHQTNRRTTFKILKK